MLELRPYQRESLDALYAYWGEGGGNGLIVLPTGAGKALVIAALVREVLEQWPDLRIAIVTHSRELVDQNAKELRGYWPAAPIGIYSAGLGRRDMHSRVLFCGIQSVHNKVRKLGAFDLVIVDEAHLIPRSADTSYGRFLNDLRALTPDMRVVGLTATPYRLDSGRLDEGEERIFDQVVYDANVGDLIAQGYLSPLMSKATMLTLDVTGVAKRGGDYVAGALEAAVDQEAITREAVAEMVAYGHERKAWLAFCTGVKHAEHVRDEIRSHGITCEMVTGETPTGQREQIIAAFKAGRIRCLTSVSVLTTGFNVPSVDMLALLRPTQSCGLYVQIVGRALRNAPGKANALILDFGGLVRRFGPIDKLVPPKPGKGDGVAPIKECPNCQSICYAAAMVCDDCGHEFPPRETVLHEARADAQHAILSTDGPPWLTVTGMSFVRHRKAGGTDSLRAEFHCGLITHRVWVCLEHTGGARNMARRFWERLGGLSPIPATVDEGLARAEDELVWPNQIQAKQNGKYWEVIGYRFAAGEGWSSRALVEDLETEHLEAAE